MCFDKMVPLPEIDFSAIPFPTDSLTVRDLRRLHPEGFDRPPPESSVGEVRHGVRGRRRSLDVVLGDLVDLEREVAESAFQSALSGTGATHPEHEPGEARKCLAAEYVRLGLAAGSHHAEQLIREVEAAAISQAERAIGRRP